MNESSVSIKSKDLRKFKRNIVYAFIAQFTSTSLSILISLILPKMLGVEEFAYWQLFIFYGGFVGLFHFGLSDGIYLKYGGTDINAMDKSVIGSQLRFMVLWQMLIGVLCILIVPFLVTDPDRVFVWVLIAIYLVVANITWCLGYIFQAANETKVYSIATIICKLSFIGTLIITILNSEYDFHIYILLYVGAQLIAMIYSVIKGWEFISSKWVPLHVTFRELFSNIQIGIYLTLSNIAGILILGFARGFVDVRWGISSFGVLSLALSLVSFILQFITQISMVMFPALRQLTSKTRDEIYLILRDSIGILLCGVLLLYMPMRIFLSWWLPTYTVSLNYLAIILPICVFDGKMQIIYNTYLKVLRKERLLLKINIFSCCLSLGLCMVLSYIHNDIIMVVMSIVITIAIRSLLSSFYLSRLMDIEYERNQTLELILTIVFIVLNLKLTPVQAFSGYLIVYMTVIIIKKEHLKAIFYRVSSMKS